MGTGMHADCRSIIGFCIPPMHFLSGEPKDIINLKERNCLLINLILCATVRLQEPRRVEYEKPMRTTDGPMYRKRGKTKGASGVPAAAGELYCDAIIFAIVLSSGSIDGKLRDTLPFSISDPGPMVLKFYTQEMVPPCYRSYHGPPAIATPPPTGLI